MVGWRSRRRRTVFPEPILHARVPAQPAGESAPASSTLGINELVEPALHQNQPLDTPTIDDLLHKVTS
jgi:hypothetical protein